MTVFLLYNQPMTNQWHREDLVQGGRGTKLHNYIISHKIIGLQCIRFNHMAATELQQLLLQNTSMISKRNNCTMSLSDFVQL